MPIQKGKETKKIQASDDDYT